MPDALWYALYGLLAAFLGLCGGGLWTLFVRWRRAPVRCTRTTGGVRCPRLAVSRSRYCGDHQPRHTQLS